MRNYRNAFVFALGGQSRSPRCARLAVMARKAASADGGCDAIVFDRTGPELSERTGECGMAPQEAALVPLQLSPERLRSIGVRTGRVERRIVEDEIHVTGNVAIDETRLSTVHVRYSGYIHKVFADATYQYLRKGQPLFTIYSPDLVACFPISANKRPFAWCPTRSSVPG